MTGRYFVCPNRAGDVTNLQADQDVADECPSYIQRRSVKFTASDCCGASVSAAFTAELLGDVVEDSYGSIVIQKNACHGMRCGSLLYRYVEHVSRSSRRTEE